MKIRDWVSKHPLGERGKQIAKIAQGCGVESAAVRHWISGRRSVNPKYWEIIAELTQGEVAISDLLGSSTTSGQVTRHELRPDVFGPGPTHPQTQKVA